MVDAAKDIESLDYAGQVILDRVEIISTNGVALNVKGLVSALEMFEDLFSPFFTGIITICESADLLNFFPLAGEEMLKLAFHTPAIDDTHHRSSQFYIYKMAELQSIGNSSNLYQLHFISMEAVIDLNTKLSRTYEGRVSDIVKKILQDPIALNTKKQINVEDTSSVTKFTANFWSPMKCINYLSNTASNIQNSMNYVFFENSQGLNFISLASLYTAPAIHQFHQNNYVRDINPGGGSTKNPDKDYMVIKELYVPEAFDYIDRCAGGMYGSQMITVDPITKRYSSKLYASIVDHTKQKHLNEFSLMSKKAIARSQQKLIYIPKHYGSTNGYTDVTNAAVVQQRTSLLKMADAFKISIRVLGKTDYTVGQKVYVSVPSKDPAVDGIDQEDKILSGFYLISAMAHTINPKTHEINMELIKDSFKYDTNQGSLKR